ncbi:3-hydroxyacyl-CoA dehydrogenase [Herbiconiux ginsengi]|uniref:3-hydroxyacyl-CoA dehydrogenase n=1 Tax=Herbiconiux ginsengi TaxID=381665 RepID=A0A1H3TYN2_9MICO|nr:3-hydroxyacyl-CoA dehydrogenase [Herbiconiux ginsengi]
MGEGAAPPEGGGRTPPESDRPAPDAARPVVAIAGAGSIGVAFAVLFASAGHPVRVWDAFPEAFERARADLRSRLGLLAEFGLLAESPSLVAGRVSFEAELADALGAAVLVQECAPERVELKRELFAAVAAVAPADAILASSSSAITPSTILAGLEPAGVVPADRDAAGVDAAELDVALTGVAARLIVAHPGNPPYLLPVIELVPSPATDAAVLDRASALYRGAGLRPVLVRKEVEGFLFNRLQGAVLREAYALVRDGVATVDDIDEVVRSGLGRRWSFIGPFETVDLNTRGGLESHAEKMGPAYERMGAERGQHDPWTPDLVATAVAQRRALLPLDEWEARVRWRDEQLMRLKPLWEGMSSR